MSKPTASELNILGLLWSAGPATVRQIHDLIGKDVAYTTTLKLMQIMLEKGMVTRDKASKSHIYKAAYSMQKAQSNGVTSMLKNVFKGSAKDLVLHALGSHETSASELREIREFLDQLEKGKDEDA